MLIRKVMVVPFVELKGVDLHLLAPGAKSATNYGLWRTSDYADIDCARNAAGQRLRHRRGIIRKAA